MIDHKGKTVIQQENTLVWIVQTTLMSEESPMDGHVDVNGEETDFMNLLNKTGHNPFQ